MSRPRAAQNCNIKPWLTAKTDCREKRFIQVGNSFILSPQIHGLTYAARCLYEAMCMESGGKSKFEFSHSAAKKYGISPTTFDRAVKLLQEEGFIVLVLDEDRSQFKTNVYRFSNEWKTKPAPHFGDSAK